MVTAQLAIHGGRPTVAPSVTVRVNYSAEAQRSLAEAVSRGALNQFYGGANVRRFEKVFAERFERTWAVSANSGTSALHLMYVASGLPPLSEVLVPANAYISAVSALLQCQLVPVLVDIDRVTWVMDPRDMAAKLTERTRAVVAVHMYGQPCPMDRILDLAHRHELLVLEDCGQSHGGRWQGRLTGTFGAAAAFSLCCRKHISMGEGGVVTTDDEEMAGTMRSLAHKGKGPQFFDYWEPGFSYALTELQAILGLDQLAFFSGELEKRQKHAATLRSALVGTDLSATCVRAGDLNAFFKFVVLLPERLSSRCDEFLAALKAEGVIADPAHPSLTHVPWLRDRKQAFLRSLGRSCPDYEDETCPVASDVLPRSLTLEVGHSLSTETVELFGVALRKVYDHYTVA